MTTLFEKLKHYYELDLKNCKMTQEDWIEELAQAMSDPDYTKNFLEDYEEYQRERWADCETCEGEHFIHSNDEKGNDQIQKCDECNIFATDQEAQKHYKDFY